MVGLLGVPRMAHFKDTFLIRHRGCLELCAAVEKVEEAISAVLGCGRPDFVASVLHTI